MRANDGIDPAHVFFVDFFLSFFLSSVDEHSVGSMRWSRVVDRDVM